MYQFTFPNAYSYVCFFLLLINVILGGKLYKTEGFSRNREHWILMLILLGSLCTVFDFLCVAFTYENNRILFFLLNAAFYITYSYTLFLLFQYTIKRYFNADVKHPKMVRFTAIPLEITVLLSILSYWTGWIFSVDENSVFSRGPYFYIYFFLGVSYILGVSILAIVYIIMHRGRTKFEPLSYAVPLIIGPIIQIALPGIPTTSMGLTVALIYIFMNNQENIIKHGTENLNLIAALSTEYESIHVANLDDETFFTIRSSSGMFDKNFDMERYDYTEITTKMVNAFVVPDDRKDFINFLKVDAMKERMSKQNRFTYRYAIMPDDSGKYIFEMLFVKANIEKDSNVLVVGTKCIDQILKLEREQGQYNAALLHDCKFFYEFDVSDGYIDGDFKSREKYNPLHGIKVQFPISYDEFNKIRMEQLEMDTDIAEDRVYWTQQGLFNAYKNGQRTVDFSYYSHTLDEYGHCTIILTEDLTDNHLHAVYIGKNVSTRIKREKKYQLQLEMALIQARKANAAKSEFLSRMSHDIRTPLHGIIGLLEINEAHSTDIELMNANRKKAKVAATHLISLVNDVLDMSKLEDDNVSLPKEPFNIFKVCVDVLTICGIRARENGIIFEHDDGKNIIYPYLIGSALHLKQILMNIINNGIKYNKKGGSIYVCSELVSYDGEMAAYEFIIKDTGIGMSQEFLSHIFEPFTQERNDARSRYQGSGMGMAIVKSLVDKMNGKISVESEEGVGTEFKVTIPFNVDHKPKIIAGNAEKKNISIKGMNLLVVEDNDLNQEIIQYILEDEGAVLTMASNGKEAVEIFMEKSAGTFDAILMDVMMPILDGYEATKQIRKLDQADASSIPIIAMTANAFEEDRRNAISSGMTDYVTKPININKLKSILAKVMDPNS